MLQNIRYFDSAITSVSEILVLFRFVSPSSLSPPFPISLSLALSLTSFTRYRYLPFALDPRVASVTSE